MSKVKFDVSDVDHDDATKEKVYEVPPVGVYPVRIAAIDAEEPEDKQPRLHVVLEITKPAKNNYGQMHDYIVFSDTLKWKMDQFLASLGITTKTKRTGEFETEKLKGRTITVKVGHETNTWKGETTTRARINFYMPKGKAAPVAEEESVDEEIDLVMHGAAADEGDEESQAYLAKQAAEYGIDPDEIESWAEVVTAIEAAQGDSEEEEDSVEDEEESDTEAVEGPDAELVESADEGDEAAAEALYEWAAENEIGEDPDEYETWAEWAEALGAEEEDAEETPDYASMSLAALKKLAKDRGIGSTGKEPELIQRHEEYDASDPFNE